MYAIPRLQSICLEFMSQDDYVSPFPQWVVLKALRGLAGVCDQSYQIRPNKYETETLMRYTCCQQRLYYSATPVGKRM